MTNKLITNYKAEINKKKVNLDFYGNFWEKIESFDDEVQSVFSVKNTFTKLLQDLDFKDKIVSDFGCGVGNAIPYLINAKQIHAIDTSPNLISKAKERFAHYNHISYIQQSMATVKVDKSDISLAINSIWPRTFEEFDIFFENIVKQTKKDGKILMVLPSLEARTFSFQLDFIYLKKDKKVATKEALDIVYDYQASSHFNAMGYLTSNSNVVQKHWLKEEILFRLESYAFKNVNISKLELDWEKQVHSPHMKDYPKFWFWLVEIEK